MSKRWYVVHAYSGFENQVKKSLVERIARAGMEEKFGEVLVPTEEVLCPGADRNRYRGQGAPH
jgi:transcriptional antiterminator NusG